MNAFLNGKKSIQRSKKDGKKDNAPVEEERLYYCEYIYQCLEDIICIMLSISNDTAHNKHVFYSITISLGILWYQSNIRTVYHDPFRYADETGVGTA